MNAKILYVEDDDALSFITIDQLSEAGFEVTHCANGQIALDTFEKEYFDLAVLDIMLPLVDGFTIAKKIRTKDTEMPIIFLSAKSLDEDRLKGFEIGADDFLVKPFNMEELIFKIKVFLKRKNVLVQYQEEEVIALGAYKFFTKNLILALDNKTKELTAKESALLFMLINRKGETLKREDILMKIWGKNDYFLGRSLDVFIARLRKYFSEDDSIQIKTIRGIGFKMEIE
ncbi:MAG: response regulator transcription factor [Chitinophagales bacterium]